MQATRQSLRISRGVVAPFGEATGPPAGILPMAPWQDEQIQIAPGDSLLLYTDGIIEARSSGTQNFSHPAQPIEYEMDRLRETGRSPLRTDPETTHRSGQSRCARFLHTASPARRLHHDSDAISLETKSDIRLDLRSEPRLLQALRKLVRGYVTAYGFSEEKADEVVLAVDEACTNAIRHAYGNHPGRRLFLEFSAQPEYIEICLKDRGRTAPAGALEKKTASAPNPKDLTPGGLGVQLIYTVFDEAEFSPAAPHGNRVRMRLNRNATKGTVS